MSYNLRNKQVTALNFNSPVKPTWCPGCGNFAIFGALKSALADQNLTPTDVLITFDIGCNGNGADKINVYGFKGLHGRSIPIAAGAYVANRKLQIIAIGGDGGIMDEGIHHLIHAIRNNYDITIIMHDNENFGLTTGQETPTTPKNQPMVASPWGVIAERLNPVQFALIAGATFVAQGFSGDQKQLKDLIVAAMQHNGCSFIHIFQHCPSYNKFEDQDWFKKRIVNIDKLNGYDRTNRIKAIETVDYSNEKRYTGVIFEDKTALPFMDRIPYRKGKKSLLKDEVRVYNIEEILEEFV